MTVAASETPRRRWRHRRSRPSSRLVAVRSPGPALLRLENISLTFRGVRALDDVSFDVPAGEICALIGPNGAGKSSLLNVISGVYVPERGRITFAGRDRVARAPHATPLAAESRAPSRTSRCSGA